MRHRSLLLLVSALLSQGCLARLDDAFSSERKDCVAALEAGLAFSEVLAAQQGDPGGDFIEIFNPSPNDVEMTGVEIFVGLERSFRIGFEDDELTLGAGEYWVLTGTPHELRPSYAAFGYGNAAGALPESGTILLRCDGMELDTFTWHGATPGRSVQLDPDVLPLPQTNDNPELLCSGTREFSEGRYGSPGSINSPCFDDERLCLDELDNLRAKDRPRPGELVITEIMPTPEQAAEDQGQWFEIYSAEPFDLNDLTIVVDGAPEQVTSANCLPVAAETRVVFSRGNLASSRLPRVDHQFSNRLGEMGTLTLEMFGEELDTVSWTEWQPGVSLSLDPDHRNEYANDDMSHWCFGAEQQVAGDFGTPGSLNPDC